MKAQGRGVALGGVALSSALLVLQLADMRAAISSPQTCFICCKTGIILFLRTKQHCGVSCVTVTQCGCGGECSGSCSSVVCHAMVFHRDGGGSDVWVSLKKRLIFEQSFFSHVYLA